MKMGMLLLPVVAATLMAQADPVELSLHRAIEIATSPEGNANVQLSGEALRQAQARSAEARGALLPDLESSLNYRNQTVNLAAEGVTEAIKVPIPGFTIPNASGALQHHGCTPDGRAERLRLQLHPALPGVQGGGGGGPLGHGQRQ